MDFFQWHLFLWPFCTCGDPHGCPPSPLPYFLCFTVHYWTYLFILCQGESIVQLFSIELHGFHNEINMFGHFAPLVTPMSAPFASSYTLYVLLCYTKHNCSNWDKENHHHPPFFSKKHEFYNEICIYSRFAPLVTPMGAPWVPLHILYVLLCYIKHNCSHYDIENHHHMSFFSEKTWFLQGNQHFYTCIHISSRYFLGPK